MSTVIDTVARSHLNGSMIPRIYDGATVFCIGGGPSLRNFDWRRLHGKAVIAINRAFEELPDAQVLFWSDFRFWRYYGDAVLKHSAELKITINDESTLAARKKGAELCHIPHTGCSGLELDPHGIKHGKNSGYAAINVAVHLGAKKIVLLGYDMKWAQGNTHWHAGYVATHTEAKLDGYRAEFAHLVAPLAGLSIAVVNACLDSRLDVWPKVSIDDVC